MPPKPTFCSSCRHEVEPDPLIEERWFCPSCDLVGYSEPARNLPNWEGRKDLQ